MTPTEIDTDTGQIRSARSIITLIVFVLANIIVLFPFDIPVYVTRPFWNGLLDTLSGLRIIPPRPDHAQNGRRNSDIIDDDDDNGKVKRPWVRLNFPMNFITAPLIGDLFLLAILAIGREEVKGGTIGSDNISPIDIMGFFITLAYIAISIDASGLIRWLAFKVLQKGGKVGHKLFFYLYAFFFTLGSFIGNDPIILSGTAFLAYMTRVSSNIVHPRAWIHTQFAVANIASAILVSSNPTNLVLAGAFGIKFIEYTANIIVPVIATAIVLFPFLLYIVFADESLIPLSIKMHELSEEAKKKDPVNPNIPNARGSAQEEEEADMGGGNVLSLEEIMNPYLDIKGAAFGGVIMTATLVTLLAINAASQKGDALPVAFVTVPAAFVMLCWDLAFGWFNRHETREIARKGREDLERARAQRALRIEEESRQTAMHSPAGTLLRASESEFEKVEPTGLFNTNEGNLNTTTSNDTALRPSSSSGTATAKTTGADNALETSIATLAPRDHQLQTTPSSASVLISPNEKQEPAPAEKPMMSREGAGCPETSEMGKKIRPRATLVSLVSGAYRWSQETFPTVTAVLAHLPFALVPFAFAMFVLVQALVTKGWVQVFAHGWDHWVNKTGWVGAIGGMAFISVILCNFSGTNIGTTILLSRVIQTWVRIHESQGTTITEQTFWGTVYAMALGVNYGAFSTAFSASLAGLLWRDILARKHIHVRRLEFARVNLPIIAIAMIVGCAVLIGEIKIIRKEDPYVPSWNKE